MSYFEFESVDFKNFLELSRKELERGFLENCFSESSFFLSEGHKKVELRIIKNIEKMTRENKIIWAKELEHQTRGVAVESRGLCNQEIVIYNHLKDSGLKMGLADYTLSFAPNSIIIECFRQNESGEINNLINEINLKLIQQSN